MVIANEKAGDGDVEAAHELATKAAEKTKYFWDDDYHDYTATRSAEIKVNDVVYYPRVEDCDGIYCIFIDLHDENDVVALEEVEDLTDLRLPEILPVLERMIEDIPLDELRELGEDKQDFMKRLTEYKE